MSRRTYSWADPKGLASIAIVALWLQIGVRGLNGCVLLGFGMATTPSAYGTFVLVNGLLSLLSMVAWIFGIVTAGMWMYRVNANAHLFRKHMSHGPWGSILWYLVPIANLIVPYEATGEVWDASRGPDTPRKSGRLVGWWWGTYLGSGVLAGILSMIVVYSPGAPLGLNGLGTLTSIVPAFLFIRIVRRITDMQIAKRSGLVFSDDSPAAAPAPLPAE